MGLEIPVLALSCFGAFPSVPSRASERPRGGVFFSFYPRKATDGMGFWGFRVLGF